MLKRNLLPLYNTYSYEIAEVVAQDPHRGDAHIQTSEEQQQEAS
jgi:hypothetical protein